MNLKRLRIKKAHLSDISAIRRRCRYLTKSTNYPIYNKNGWYMYGSHSWIEIDGVTYTSMGLYIDFKNQMDLLNHKRLSFNEVLYINKLLKFSTYERKEYENLHNLLITDMKYYYEFCHEMIKFKQELLRKNDE